MRAAGLPACATGVHAPAVHRRRPAVGHLGQPSILNASPEAAAGGGLALLRTGDRVRIDLRKGEADVLDLRRGAGASAARRWRPRAAMPIRRARRPGRRSSARLSARPTAAPMLEPALEISAPGPDRGRAAAQSLSDVAAVPACFEALRQSDRAPSHAAERRCEAAADAGRCPCALPQIAHAGPSRRCRASASRRRPRPLPCLYIEQSQVAIGTIASRARRPRRACRLVAMDRLVVAAVLVDRDHFRDWSAAPASAHRGAQVAAHDQRRARDRPQRHQRALLVRGEAGVALAERQPAERQHVGVGPGAGSAVRRSSSRAARTAPRAAAIRPRSRR